MNHYNYLAYEAAGDAKKKSDETGLEIRREHPNGDSVVQRAEKNVFDHVYPAIKTILSTPSTPLASSAPMTLETT